MTMRLRKQKARCSNHSELSLSSLKECRETMQDYARGQYQSPAGRKGVEELLLVGHEKVPCRFGLRTGDLGNTAGGAGN